MAPDFKKFEKNAGLSFGDKSLLKQAFTHRSYINENRGSKLEHNERLEFLGDAVLELIVTDFLYKKYPKSTEGDLTSYRSALVNAITCADVATKLGVNELMLLSKGEAKDTGRARQYILANALEAIIGAIFVDQGYNKAEEFVHRFILDRTEEIVKNKAWLDPKSRLQEEAQDRIGLTPSYKVVKEEGPDHDKRFTVAIYLGKESVATGEGKSKQEAEQNAAEQGLIVKGWYK